MKWMWVVLLIALVSTKGVAGTIQAASCSQSAVQQAIDSSLDGDTVAVPAGTCTWASTVTIPKTKGITLQGAGIDQTAISGTVRVLLQINGSAGRFYRVTGFTMNDPNRH